MWLALVALKLNDHVNATGVTPEQPVRQGDDLCPARDGTCGEPWAVPAGLHPLPLPGVKGRRALFLPQGGPNVPHHGTVTGYTALLAPTHPCCRLCFSIPTISNGGHCHRHRPRSLGQPQAGHGEGVTPSQGTHQQGKDELLGKVENLV